MRRLITVMLMTVAIPALASPAAPEVRHFLLACAATNNDRPDVITINVHSGTNTVTVLLAFSGAYVLREMPAHLTSEILTFADQQEKWSLDRASLKLSKVGSDSKGVSSTQQCSYVREQDVRAELLF